MRKPKPPTENALLEALRQFGKAIAKRPGEHWYTLEELAAMEETTPPAIKYRMQQARKRGIRIEQAYGTALDSEGQAKRTMYYKLAAR